MLLNSVEFYGILLNSPLQRSNGNKLRRVKNNHNNDFQKRSGSSCEVVNALLAFLFYLRAKVPPLSLIFYYFLFLFVSFPPATLIPV